MIIPNIYIYIWENKKMFQTTNQPHVEWENQWFPVSMFNQSIENSHKKHALRAAMVSMMGGCPCCNLEKPSVNSGPAWSSNPLMVNIGELSTTRFQEKMWVVVWLFGKLGIPDHSLFLPHGLGGSSNWLLCWTAKFVSCYSGDFSQK